MEVGVDLISVDRFMGLKKGDQERWRHVFSEKEWGYAFKDNLSSQHLAGIFTAKEACMKATGLVGREHYLTFDIAHDQNGKPYVDGKDLKISISHSDGFAVAVALSI